MKKFFAFLIFFSATALAAPNPVTISGGLSPANGWMSNAWNWGRFKFQNNANTEFTVLKYHGSWRGSEDFWENDVQVKLPPKGEGQWESAMYYPNEMQNLSPKGPAILGYFTVQSKNGKEIKIPYDFEVKTATLETPLVAVTGTYMVISLQKKNWTNEPWEKELLDWMDETYAAMTDLVGRRPFDGALSRIEETPNSFAWAYAGNPIVLTGDFVPSTLQDFKKGLLSFGWTHEMGHNFDDKIGEYYIWNAACAEFHANLKVCYAFEHMECAKKLGLEPKFTKYYPLDKTKRIAPNKLSDTFFLCFGDEYLADQKRTWDTLNSDEINAFFQRIIKVYGWDVIKRWYRLFVDLDKKGFPIIEKEEDRMPVALAALNKACGHNLIKTYQLWRFPVTEEQLLTISKKYGWDK